MSVPRIKYACCSHGPQHLRTRPHCGFAHVLHELDFPERIHSRLWCDRSHEHEGPAGIDIFVGQEYTPKQLDRLFAMLANEGLVGIPAWARQLAWFLGHGSSQYANDGDFGYFARMQIVSCAKFKTIEDGNGLYWGAQSNQYIEIQEACEETKRNSNNTKSTSNKFLAC